MHRQVGSVSFPVYKYRELCLFVFTGNVPAAYTHAYKYINIYIRTGAGLGSTQLTVEGVGRAENPGRHPKYRNDGTYEPPG